MLSSKPRKPRTSRTTLPEKIEHPGKDVRPPEISGTAIELPVDEAIPVYTSSGTSVKAVVAKRVTELIKQNPDLTPKTALHLLGQEIPLNSIVENMRALIKNALLDADKQRAALRAGRFQAFMDLLVAGLGGDLKALKLAAEFSKQIGADPEIGLSQPPLQQVNIEIKAIESLLGSIEEDYRDAEKN